MEVANVLEAIKIVLKFNSEAVIRKISDKPFPMEMSE